MNRNPLPDRVTGLPVWRPHPARSAFEEMEDVGLCEDPGEGRLRFPFRSGGAMGPAELAPD